MPLDVKAELTTLSATEIPRARWLHPSDFHLTVRFIGTVDANTRQRYIEALATVRWEAFPLSLQGVGRFPVNPRKPARVLWAGVTQSPELTSLYKRVSAALESTGLGSDRYPTYSPHVTLPRLKGDSSPELNQFFTAHADYQSPTFTVDTLALFDNGGNADGGRYRVLETFSL